MRNISLEVEKVGYSGEFYFKATLDMAIYKEIGEKHFPGSRKRWL